MKRERVQKQRTSAKQRDASETEVSADTKQELKDDLDALLADIDEALGENVVNAEEFVEAYQQKGGE